MPTPPPDAAATARELASRTRAAAAVCAAHQWPAPHLIRAASGTAVFRTGNLAVRVAAPGRLLLPAPGQVRLARLLTDHDIAVPSPVGTAQLTDDGDELTVMTWVDHDPYAELPGHLLGQTLARIHNLDPGLVTATLGTPLENSIRGTAADARTRMTQLHRSDHALPARLLSRLAHVVEWASAPSDNQPAPAVFVHGDIHTDNLRWTRPTHQGGQGAGDRVTLLDWEGAGVGPWWWELTHLRRHLAVDQINEDTWTQLLTGYGRDPATEPDAHDGWPAAVALRSVNHVLWLWLGHLHGAADADEATSAMDWFARGMPGLP